MGRGVLVFLFTGCGTIGGGAWLGGSGGTGYCGVIMVELLERDDQDDADDHGVPCEVCIC